MVALLSAPGLTASLVESSTPGAEGISKVLHMGAAELSLAYASN